MPFPPSASAIAEAFQHLRSFRGRLIYRQVLTARRRRLWAPSSHPWRWNTDFPALYTSLEENVAIAERIKLTLARPTAIVLAWADAVVRDVLDLTDPAIQALLKVDWRMLVADTYDVPQTLAPFWSEPVCAVLWFPRPSALLLACSPRSN